ncbi:MAG: RNA methyltransferase [Flavobacteriales bacterium]|nr:RNA methyltransferase [Flavobacteriales bacterium]
MSYLPERLKPEYTQLLLSFLFGMITENKQKKFREAIAQRTRKLTVVIEDFYQPHNASALLRSCDCFGIQDIHIIENKHQFEVIPDIVRGASKWLTVNRYKNKWESPTPSCLSRLKDQGYFIWGTKPDATDINLEDLAVDQPIAVVFGTEKLGLSDAAISHCDGFLKVPMYGFTESLNVSVCAGIILHHLVWKLKSSEVLWTLSEEEKTDLLIQWAFKVTKNKKELMKSFLKNYPDASLA